jgi:hypothetical protein
MRRISRDPRSDGTPVTHHDWWDMVGPKKNPMGFPMGGHHRNWLVVWNHGFFMTFHEKLGIS